LTQRRKPFYPQTFGKAGINGDRAFGTFGAGQRKTINALAARFNCPVNNCVMPNVFLVAGFADGDEICKLGVSERIGGIHRAEAVEAIASVPLSHWVTSK